MDIRAATPNRRKWSAGSVRPVAGAVGPFGHGVVGLEEMLAFAAVEIVPVRLVADDDRVAAGDVGGEEALDRLDEAFVFVVLGMDFVIVLDLTVVDEGRAV
ncbi:hypothetical protein SD71_13555 [Cohnella kolymensis]|uniref:Uncharacterized protein n=1 Tax=Cohnella kolymensis TaxID=1590652 RepID=A0ABR5A2R3_9BACL|nr:hypothetical protein SD71_13555 [Cohnella kolymensis]